LAAGEQPEPRYASWGRRAGGLLLVGLIVVAPFLLLAIVLAVVIGPDDKAVHPDATSDWEGC